MHTLTNFQSLELQLLPQCQLYWSLNKWRWYKDPQAGRLNQKWRAENRFTPKLPLAKSVSSFPSRYLRVDLRNLRNYLHKVHYGAPEYSDQDSKNINTPVVDSLLFDEEGKTVWGFQVSVSPPAAHPFKIDNVNHLKNS